MNDLFKALGGNPGQPMQRPNPLQMLQSLKGNPAQFLTNAGYQIPAGLNNPQAIIQHLLQTGQVTNARLTQAQQMARNFPRR